MKHKIVLLKGGATTGKSTAFKGLKERNELKEYIFIDHPELKKWFDGKLEGKDLSKLRKRALFSMIKEIMKYKKDILFEEMNGKTVKKFLKRQIKIYNYEVITFEFIIEDIKHAVERDKQRIKDKVRHHTKVLGKKFLINSQLFHKQNLDKNCIFVNTSKLNKKQVLNFIIEKLK